MTSPEPRPGRGRPRRVAILVGALAVVAIAFGVAILARGDPDAAAPTATSGAAESASPAFTDLVLIPVAPTGSAVEATPAVTAAPGLTTPPASASPSVDATATLSADAGVRAKRIRIARLDIDLKVIEGDGIDAPIGKVAHYPGSAWPGAGSNIYIYGHAREGMFLNLWKARVGDVVQLDLVDGTTRTYVVDRVLPKVPWDAVRYTQPTKSEQLTLQTSTSYHPTSPRFIVIAHPAP